ncbi:hypothetical protein [Clostridium fallax]|uniref:Dipeptidyl peptidase IV (DPP IV) N-terminal region n=1 Tax=Clostridium fallax TaxID=1533 RepID=A0A1M4WTN4_9CLOT|nr:hypothetical protein [Clostridium fallax]SHE84555.1 hypothetical protein SAMN05443638_1148 [Clostridium fallax]SQB07399.1 dipeptidyl peptidase IV [Clostridium fallax]
MKKVRIIFAWVIVSLIVQVAGLLFLDKYFFQSDGSVKSKKIEVKDKAPKKLANIKVPEGSKNIKLSFDGKYISYEDSGILKVSNTWDGSTLEVKNNINSKLMNYTWLSDRHRILIGERNNNSGMLTLSYYDVAKNEKREITSISEISKKSELSSIEASTLTDVTYLKITDENKYTKIYRLDINQKLKKESLMCKSVGNIEVIPHEDRLLYEDSYNKQIYVTSPQKKLAFGKNKVKLLKVDSEDVVYVGILSGEKISEIKYGTLGENTNDWKTINLKDSVEKDDILISQKGQIFYNDSFKGELIDLSKDKKYNYKGKFISIFDDGYGTLIDSKLNIQEFK